MSRPELHRDQRLGASLPGGPSGSRSRQEVGQGQLAVGGDGLELTATLGSCIGFCLFDPDQRKGGMTHIFQCVDDGPLGPAAVIAEIERLVNALMGIGVGRGQLQAKLVGGARTLPFGRDHGAAMGAACQDYLTAEGIPIRATDLGGKVARRVQFLPGSGLLDISKTKDVAAVEEPPASVVGNAPDLF